MLPPQPIVSIIFTHQARLRCFLHDLIYSEFEPRTAITSLYEKDEVARFKNGSMVELRISPDTIEVKLIINGEIGEDEKKGGKYVYYVKEGTAIDDEGAQKGQYQVTPFPYVNMPNEGQFDVGSSTYIFYLVRHGQAAHNLYSTKSEKVIAQLIPGSSRKDTHLTQGPGSGEAQAQATGKEFSSLLAGNEALVSQPKYFFASDLIRTRETFKHFLGGFQFAGNANIVVLPCSHELDYNKSGNCDGVRKAVAKENLPTCNMDSRECTMIGNHEVDWSLYKKFYNNTLRKGISLDGVLKSKNSPESRRHCSTTDMVTEAINYIKNRPQQGGRKRRRKTKKRRTRKRRSKKRKTRRK
jgi:hypothetical protein